jgi:hypothetical protein
LNPKEVFQAHLETCERHAERLAWAMNTLANLFPLSPEALSRLTAIDLAVMDQFVVRYSKLQDAMGAKLLPAVLELTQEQGEMRTFVDKLNRLEKIGALSSADKWQEFREMRNQFAHDYPDDPEIQASLLNKAYQLAEGLLKALDEVKAFSEPYCA